MHATTQFPVQGKAASPPWWMFPESWWLHTGSGLGVSTHWGGRHPENSTFENAYSLAVWYLRTWPKLKGWVGWDGFWIAMSCLESDRKLLNGQTTKQHTLDSGQVESARHTGSGFFLPFFLSFRRRRRRGRRMQGLSFRRGRTRKKERKKEALLLFWILHWSPRPSCLLYFLPFPANIHPCLLSFSGVSQTTHFPRSPLLQFPLGHFSKDVYSGGIPHGHFDWSVVVHHIQAGKYLKSADSYSKLLWSLLLLLHQSKSYAEPQRMSCPRKHATPVQ